MRWLNRIFRRELGEEVPLIPVDGWTGGRLSVAVAPPASVLRTGGNCKERHNDCDDLPGFHHVSSLWSRAVVGPQI